MLLTHISFIGDLYTMINIKLVQPKLTDVDFKFALTPPSDGSAQLEIGAKFNFKINFTADNCHCVATLQHIAEYTEDPSLFHVNITYEGFFETPEIKNDDDKKAIHIQAYYHLFPYVQIMTNHLVVSSGLQPLFFQPIDMTEDMVSIQD